MHESSLSEAVLTVLRGHPGPHHRIRVHVAHPDTPVEDLAQILRIHLTTADPPPGVAEVEVVPLPRPRACAACGHGWTSAETSPACPRCGGPPLPPRHDHTIEVELLD